MMQRLAVTQKGRLETRRTTRKKRASHQVTGSAAHVLQHAKEKFGCKFLGSRSQGRLVGGAPLPLRRSTPGPQEGGRVRTSD